MKKKIVAIPWMGEKYTKAIANAIKSLGVKVMLPEQSAKHLKVSLQNSSDMMCFPYKGTLANYVNVLERGANILLMWDSCGECRLKHYYKIHEFTLKKMGYNNFTMMPVTVINIVSVLKKISGCSTLKALQTVKKLIKDIKKIDEETWQLSKNKVNIGIIGEIYTCCDERINYNLESKIRKYGGSPYNASNLSQFINESIKGKMFIGHFGKRKYKKMADRYLNGKLGGHGKENIYNLFWLNDQGIDGIVHLLPLSCMPETTVEPFIDHICEKYKIPLLRLPMDETNSEANVETRVETFVELIKRKSKLQNKK